MGSELNDSRSRFIGLEDLPFDPRRDYHLFMETDRESPRYRRPEFLLPLYRRGEDFLIYDLRCAYPRDAAARRPSFPRTE